MEKPSLGFEKIFFVVSKDNSGTSVCIKQRGPRTSKFDDDWRGVDREIKYFICVWCVPTRLENFRFKDCISPVLGIDCKMWQSDHSESFRDDWPRNVIQNEAEIKAVVLVFVVWPFIKQSNPLKYPVGGENHLLC